MKYINKFIATGLGFALIFTGTNFVHGMFKSSARQNNVITIKQASIDIDTNGLAYFHGKSTGGQKYNELYIPVNINGIKPEDLTITATINVIGSSTPVSTQNVSIGSGVLTDGKNGSHLSDTDVTCIIIQTKDLGDFQTKEKYNITITVEISDNQIFEETHGVQKSNEGNSCCDSIYKKGINHIKLVDQFKHILQDEELDEHVGQEVEEPSKPEVVEPPKEEVEPPKEEVEKPSEPEVVEPPKEEIVEIPKQPEAIEPPKENEGIQE